MGSDKTIKKVTYSTIKIALSSALAPSFVFLRDSMAKDHLGETLHIFDSLVQTMSDWLEHVSEKLGSDDSDIFGVELKKIASEEGSDK